MEKVEARQSAGYDAARARVVDRLPDQTRLTDEDKQAARALLRKKKRKERGAPFYQRGWFVGACLVLLLAAIGVVFYFAFLRKPSPDDLYAQAKALMATDDAKKWLEARSGPVKEYLDYYGDRDDDLTTAMKNWDALAWETDSLRRARADEKLGSGDPDEA